MTYCLAIAADDGLVFVSDSRTSAGLDVINTYSKMYGFGVPGERQLTILTSGNLATSQSVISQIKKDLKLDGNHLFNLGHMTDVAEYIGEVSRYAQQKMLATDVNVESYFLVGGQIGEQRHSVYLVYPQGNYISTSQDTTYLQIGESKYGKPILDRILTRKTSLEDAARCAMVSMDSTLRSNATVGAPIELLVYEDNTYESDHYLRFEEDDDYLRAIRQHWNEALKEAFSGLPHLDWEHRTAESNVLTLPHS